MTEGTSFLLGLWAGVLIAYGSIGMYLWARYRK